MSGIVGIVHEGREAVDVRLVERMTESLRGAAPDGQRVWVDGPVGLGHAWLRTSDDPVADHAEPLSLDGRVWITADARVDGRSDLVRAMRAHGEDASLDTSDAGLILRAYRVWGEDCVRYLLGDFAFAIWDRSRRRLFCARDHFGVKPLFYAQTPAGLVFSNSLECVRLHPAVTAALDDEGIAGFLRGGAVEDPARTCFAGIRRLPAAHRLTAERGVMAQRYWRLPVDGAIRYGRGDQYVEHFAEVLEQAVGDRVRGRRVGVLMSGGLDSTTVAATAQRWLSRQRAPFELRAYTTVCRSFADPEEPYARLAADALSMPIHYRVADDYALFERWDKPELRRPEPESDPLLALHVDQLADAAAHARVLLTGYGGDPLARVPLRYALDLLRRGKVMRLVTEVARYVAVCRRLPRIRIRAHACRWVGWGRSQPADSPRWLRAAFHQSAGGAAVDRARVHPTRPDAYELLTSTDWPLIFESYHPGITGVPVEVSHPFFDRRVVEYFLAIPAMPWCFDKTVMRLAMRGALPDAVRLRPKTLAAGDPLVALLQRPDAEWVDRFEPVAALRRYVDRGRVPPVRGEGDSGRIWTNLRPLCLDHWLKSHDAS